MKNWNLFAIMIVVALFAVSCGDEDPNTNIGGTCSTENALMCEGDAILQCTGGNWAEIWNCADEGQGTCTQNGTVASCTGTTSDNTLPTDTDTTTPTDTDTPVTGTCGDNITNGTDVCDGDPKNCVDISASYTGGIALCKADCTGWDTSSCQGAADTDTATPDTDTVASGKTCSEINTCMGDCADQACVDACFAAGTTEAQAQYNALMTCVEGNCATECGSGGSNEACNTCAGEKCPDEMDACFTVNVTPYGTMNAPNANIPYIYDGDGDVNAQLQANQSGAVMNGVFTGTYGPSKPLPPNGGQQTFALAIHYAADGANPAALQVQQLTQTSTALVNPIILFQFTTDAVTPGQYTVDLTQEATALSYLINVDANNNQCMLAFVSGSTVNVTASTNTTAPSGGSITFNATNLKLYHPTETPFGDISADLGQQITICVKE